MVIGDSVQCDNCHEKYRIRYSVGNRFPQTATFRCKVCGEAITYGYSKDRIKITNGIKVISDDFSLQVINLHPELPINPDNLSDPYYFPNMELLIHQKGLGDVLQMRIAQTSMASYLEHWDNVQQDFRYLIEQRWPMLVKRYGNDNAKTEKRILRSVIDTTHFYLEGKDWKRIYRQTLDELKKAQRNPNFYKFKDFLSNYKNDFLHHKMFSVMKKYRGVETELLPALLNQKLGLDQSGYSSSPIWENIEKIYGDFYELYGDLLIIPTVLNNLNIRNDIQKFDSVDFTITKYEATDKAGKCKNFLDNENLKALSDYYNATIRNSTHHDASSYRNEDQNIIMKTGKGGKTEKTMPLMEYLIHCNEIYARCLILFNIMFKIVF